MSEPSTVRASDADRERTVLLLREHTAEGRLTLEEFTERMETAYSATTQGELQVLTGDLPLAPAQGASRQRPTQLVGAIFGSTEKAGPLRVARRLICLCGFGNVDLDLRQAAIEGDEVTVAVAALCSSIDVLVPEGIEVDLHGLAVFGPRRERGPDTTRPGAPVVHVYAFSLFSAIGVWRVPFAWMRRSLEDVIAGLESRREKELEA
jgi:hypothetical protein